MTVEELIKELQKIKDKTKYVDLEGEIWMSWNTEDPYDEGYYVDKSYCINKVVEEKNYVAIRW